MKEFIFSGIIIVAGIMWVGCGSDGKKCKTNSDCSSGYICLNSECVALTKGECTSDADCPENYTCLNNECVPKRAGSCNANTDCPQGYICEGNECIIPQIDTTPPDTTITSYPSNPTNSTSATFEFMSSEAGSTFECQLDSGGWSSCTSPKTYPGLATGSHTFEVRAIDLAGNKDPTPASYTWTIITGWSFGGSGDDVGYSVQETSDGGYIIVGSTTSYGAKGFNLYLIKTDVNGNEVWSQTFGAAGDDVGYSVQQTSDGGYIIVGSTTSYGAKGFDLYLIKTDANGAKVWAQRFGAAGDDVGYSVQETSDGGYIIVGSTTSYGAGLTDVYLIKTDANGNIP